MVVDGLGEIQSIADPEVDGIVWQAEMRIQKGLMEMRDLYMHPN